MTLAVEIKDLKKTYAAGKKNPAKEALKGISLEIPQGSFYGLLGPNGAGKSTIINIMAGLVVKTSGDVKICGYDNEKDMRLSRLAIGVVPQELVLDTFFTVRQALDIHAGYYGVPKSKRRTDEIIAAMGLTDKADVHSRQLSGGMRRRLLIAKALVHNPPVLVLDEPTAGVDVELRTQLWEYVKELNRQGTTILLTTHYLEEAQELCDRIAIINHGNVVAEDRKQNLMKAFDRKQLCVKLRDPITEIPASLSNFGWSKRDDEQLEIQYKPSQQDVESLLEPLKAEGYHVKDLSTSEPDLEEVFLHFTSAKAA